MLNSQRKKIQFNDNVQTFYIPYEERKGIWMTYTLDRAHFQRRIELTEKVLSPMLQNKLTKSQSSKSYTPKVTVTP